MDDFLIYAILAGIGVACSICPVGCVVLWKKVPYFGDAIAHASILGIVIALVAGIDPMLGVTIVSLTFAVFLIYFKKADEESVMTVILSYTFLALGLFALEFVSTDKQIDIFSYLFGDILLVSKFEVIGIAVSAVLIAVWLYFRWQKLLLSSINEDMALVEGINVRALNFEFLAIVAFLTGISVKIIGVLLVASMLVIPAAAARNFSDSPRVMLLSSVLIGLFAMLCGIAISCYVDSPSGPSIVLSAAIAMAASLCFQRPGLRQA